MTTLRTIRLTIQRIAERLCDPRGLWYIVLPGSPMAGERGKVRRYMPVKLAALPLYTLDRKRDPDEQVGEYEVSIGIGYPGDGYDLDPSCLTLIRVQATDRSEASRIARVAIRTQFGPGQRIVSITSLGT